MVRQPLAVPDFSRRTLLERVLLRLPRPAADLFFRAVWAVIRRLEPGSRLRRQAVRYAVSGGLAVLNRRDLTAFELFVHPEIESVNTSGVVGIAGLPAGSRGREEWLAAQTRWLTDWEEFRYEATEVIDLRDDRLLLLGRVRATAGGSGIVVDSEWGLLATISRGLLARESNYLDRAEALEAAGLAE